MNWIFCRGFGQNRAVFVHDEALRSGSADINANIKCHELARGCDLKNGEMDQPCLHVLFARPHTILLKNQEQNRPSKMTIESFETRVAISMPVKIIMKLGFLLLCLGLISLPGCGTGSKNPEPVAEPTASSRPALKIWIIDTPELEKVISVRWQAASDQTLKIEQIP